MGSNLLTVHPLLSDRARLAIMVALASATEKIDFNELLSSLELTRGNLSSHLRRLEEAKLINVTKEFVERKPRTTYECSASGKAAVREYLEAVERALQSISPQKRGPGSSGRAK